MVALFVVLMIAIFLVIDIVLHVRHQPAFADQLQSRMEASAAALPRIAGFRVDPALAYHSGHTWARHIGQGLARVGVDDFAARLIGRPDRIELPAVGTSVRAGRPLLTVIHKGRRVPVVAPVSGTVAAVNTAVLTDGGAVLDSPYGAGWMVDIKSAELSYDLRSLLTGEMARRFIDEAAAALHTVFAPAELAPAAADGGEPVQGISDMLDDAAWDRVRSRFLLTEGE